MSIKTFRYEKQHNYADKNIRSRLLEEIKDHPGHFASEHEYGCLNIIGKAKERKDLHCIVRLNDLSFFSAAKQIIRKLCGVCGEAEARAEKAEAARDVLARLVASGGFDCPGYDGECPYGNGEEACICKSTEMGSDARCWVDWAHQQSSQKD